jgi:hypothetical protein
MRARLRPTGPVERLDPIQNGCLQPRRLPVELLDLLTQRDARQLPRIHREELVDHRPQVAHTRTLRTTTDSFRSQEPLQTKNI